MVAAVKKFLSAFNPVLVSAFLVSFGVLSSEPVRGGPTTAELLQKYDAWLDAMRSVHFDSTETITDEGSAIGKATWVGSATTTVYKLGELWRLRARHFGRSWMGNRFHPYADGFEMTFDSNKARHAFHETYDVNGLSADEHELAKVLDKPSGSYVVGLTINDTSPDAVLEKQEFLPSLLYGAFGNNAGSAFRDMVRSADGEVSVSEVSTHGRKVWRLTHSGRFGKHILELDPESGFCPTRFAEQKDASDLFGRVPLKEVGPILHDAAAPQSPVSQYTRDIEARTVQQVGPHSLPVALEITTTILYENGALRRQIDRAQLSNVTWDPPADGLKPTLTVPDGTEAHISNAPLIVCEWRGGQVVRLSDQRAINTLADLQSFGNDGSLTTRRRFIVIGINVALLVLLAAYIALRRLKTKRLSAGRTE